MTTIRDVFTTAAQGIQFQADRDLVNRLTKFERDVATYSESQTDFLGSQLAGVYPFKFTQSMRDTWFLEVIGLDELDLDDALKRVDYLKGKDWKRATDAFNLSAAWILHELSNSKSLSIQDRQRGMQATALVMQYKFMGSILSYYFKFPADQAIMEAVMASLSRKYAIKTAGTWGKLFAQRAEEITSARSIHHQTYVKFTSDSGITYFINDVQGRLRELIKNICAQFYKMRDSQTRITADRSMTEIDGEAILRDKSRKFTTYLRYIHEVISDRKSFIRSELVSVITDLMHTVPERHLIEALEWLSLNHRVKGAEAVEQLVDEAMQHCFQLMIDNRAQYGKDINLEALLIRLRALYTASRMSDETLLKMRDLAERIVQRSVSSKNQSIHAGVRTAMILYIVLRCLAMQHYS